MPALYRRVSCVACWYFGAASSVDLGVGFRAFMLDTLSAFGRYMLMIFTSLRITSISTLRFLDCHRKMKLGMRLVLRRPTFFRMVCDFN